MIGDQKLITARSRQLLRVVENWISAILALVLMASSIQHINNPYAFLSSVYSYQTVGMFFGVVVAAVLPFVQLIIAMSLLSDSESRFQCFGIASLIFFIFCVMQVVAYTRGLNISCGCFGPASDEPIGVRSIILVFACTVLSIAGLLLSKKSRVVLSSNTPS